MNPSEFVNRAIARLSIEDTVARQVVGMVRDIEYRGELADLAETYRVLRAKRGCRR